MKIVDIRTIPLSYRCEPPYGSAGGMQARRGALLVEIETDERVIGIGEAGGGGGSTRDVIEKQLRPMLIGEDPLLIERPWQKVFGRNPSTQTHLRHLVEHAELCEVEPEEDIARVAAVRKALGPHAKLMVDVNCAWSPALAIRMGHALEPYDLYWIEEPVATDDIEGSARVAAALATPIAGYETEIGLYGFRELITRGAVDIVQPDLAWSGGFSECRRIAAYAQAHHRMVAPHAFASAVNLVAALHFAAAMPNALVLEWDQNPNAIRDELLKEPLRLEKDGNVR